MITPSTQLPCPAGRDRLQLLNEWLNGKLPAVALTAEASPRRYFRSRDYPELGWLRVTSPAPAPHATTRFLHQSGVSVPALGSEREGCYLVADLGDTHLADQPVLEAYQQLLVQWHRFAHRRLPPGHPNAGLALDAKLFKAELALFRDAYLQRLHNLAELRPGSFLAALRHACSHLAQRAAGGPQCLQHRDLHSRNILLSDRGPVWIDHQDLRRGPLYYDLSSLLTDAYLDLPTTVRLRLEAEIGILATRYALPAEQAADQYWATALQRVLKALGTFGRLQLEGRKEYAAAARRGLRHARHLLALPPSAVDPDTKWIAPLREALDLVHANPRR